MSQELWEIVMSSRIEELELQLALQCAPLIAGLKISNLLNIKESDFAAVKRIIAGSNISWHTLLRHKGKMTMLLYRAESLKGYLNCQEVKRIFGDFGYTNMELSEVFREFCARYENYMVHRQSFPHEMGLLLGYPVEDVSGFIRNKGKDSLHTGYWKVYENKDMKLRLFESYENAKESLIQRLSCGASMVDIIQA